MGEIEWDGKIYSSIEEMFNDLDAEIELKTPKIEKYLRNLIDEKLFKDKNIFGYNYSCLLFNPIKVIQECLSQIKYAYQRIFRK